MKTRLSSKGQIVLPAEVRAQDQLRTGQQFEIARLKAGEYLLKRVPGPGDGGVMEWLESCPVKGWFEPIPSESTATL
jgi:AbrB family looped-hinge helix DNA binding protein